MKITIKFEDGTIYSFKSADTIHKVNPQKEVFLLFSDVTIWRGFTTGVISEDGLITLSKPGAPSPIGLPYNKLVGWCYSKKRVDP